MPNLSLECRTLRWIHPPVHPHGKMESFMMYLQEGSLEELDISPVLYHLIQIYTHFRAIKMHNFKRIGESHLRKFMEVKQPEFHPLAVPGPKSNSIITAIHILISTAFSSQKKSVVFLLNSIIFGTFLFPILPELACKQHLAQRFIPCLLENILRLVISNHS